MGNRNKNVNTNIPDSVAETVREIGLFVPGQNDSQTDISGNGSPAESACCRDGSEAVRNVPEEKKKRGRKKIIDNWTPGESRMREKEYYALLRDELEQRKGADVDLSFREVQKNNGIYRKACTVRFSDAQIAPTIYLDAYYDNYLHGEAVGESAESILKYCRQKTPRITFPETFFQNYEDVRHRLGVKLICAGKNRELLEDVPHVCIEDLAAIFYYLLEDPSLDNGMIILRNSDIRRWGKTAEDIYSDAVENCSIMLPPVFRPLSDILDIIGYAPEGELYLLTNESALYGAAAILYPGLLEEIAERLGRGFFILPSSIHETILLPDYGEDPESLCDIVSEINLTQVAQEDVLADAVYHYSVGDGGIRKLA